MNSIAIELGPTAQAQSAAAPIAWPPAIPDKPTHAELVRQKLDLVDAADDDFTRFAMEVQKKLGYLPLLKTTSAPTRLQQVLAELDIEPFELTSVADYKRRMCEHFQAQLDQSQEAPAIGPLAPLMNAGRQTARWARERLECYERPVPQFVLRKCLAIKERLPRAIFVIDELQVGANVPCPFLIVSDKMDYYTIEVWDEPEFEKTL